MAKQKVANCPTTAILRYSLRLYGEQEVGAGIILCPYIPQDLRALHLTIFA